MKPAEAEVQYKQAIQLYSARYSDTESHAKCMYNLGLLLEQSGRTAEAVLQFQTAKQIFDIAGSSHFASYCGRSLQRLEA
jgi:tetratricopeptide (TPR) repeat protein